jgi:hypothetical protein
VLCERGHISGIIKVYKLLQALGIAIVKEFELTPAVLEDNRKATRINNQTADDTRRTMRLIIAGTPLTAVLL